MTGKKTVLIILDGWGHGNKTKSDAIHCANTPFIDSLYNSSPNCELKTFGEHVGLPTGQMGNSEVGHLNIGAGRIIYQELAKINLACENNSIAKIESLKNTFDYSIKNKKPLHFIGLVSDGGVHSHQEHLYKLCELAQKSGVKEMFIHAFTDGRDCDPQSAYNFIKTLEKNLHGSKIASVCGRYYAMDRDQRWERTKYAYDLITEGRGTPSSNLLESIKKSYNNGVTDEFIKPIVHVDQHGKKIGNIKEGDAVICFNFRTDRCRQITSALTQSSPNEYGMRSLKLYYTTMTNYDNDFKGINVIFHKKNIKNTIGEVLEKNNKSQIRIAETEKYPHVTYFFSGGKESEFVGENRIMIDSPKVATYDLQPEMSAEKVCTSIIAELKKGIADFICVNFANPDMVGHTGDYKAIIQAVEKVDQCTKKIVDLGTKKDYAFIIISDHGNAEFTINDDGTPNTSHTKNLVPCFAVNTGYNKIENGKLGDISPTILHIMGLEIPKEMTGKILIK